MRRKDYVDWTEIVASDFVVVGTAVDGIAVVVAFEDEEHVEQHNEELVKQTLRRSTRDRKFAILSDYVVYL